MNLRIFRLTMKPVCFLAALALTGCTTVRTSQDYSRSRPDFRSFVVMPAQVVAEEVLADKSLAERSLMAERLSESISLELESNLRASGFAIAYIPPQENQGETGELQKSYASTVERILKNVYTSENSPSFNYTVGDVARRVGERHQAQALVLALMNARVKSAEGWKQNFVDSATQMALQGSGTVFTRSSSDLHLAVIEAGSGKIIWFNTRSSRTFFKDGTTPGAVRQLVEETFWPFFQVEKSKKTQAAKRPRD